MISNELLDILVCVETKQELSLADAELIGRVNHLIEAGKLVNRGGGRVEEPLQGGLVTKDGAILYPIRDDVPVMIVEESIATESIAAAE